MQYTPEMKQGFYGGHDGRPLGYFCNDGHSFCLTVPYVYVDIDGCPHMSSEGLKSDGGSVPRFFWRLIGGPFQFAVEAYITHDEICEKAAKLDPDAMQAMRDIGDALFREILDYLNKTGRKHLPKWKRILMEKGVRSGSRSAVRTARRTARA